MEFNSQICTTKEQSERLLALRLKRETADMYATDMSSKGINYTDDWKIGAIPYCNAISFLNSQGLQLEKTAWSFIPAWSLHRLIEMCNKTQAGMTIGIYNDEVTVDGDLFEVFDNTYDNLISIIGWLIDLDKFNENYLNIH